MFTLLPFALLTFPQSDETRGAKAVVEKLLRPSRTSVHVRPTLLEVASTERIPIRFR